MVYGNTDEIFDALAITRRRILERVENISDDAASSRPAPDVWSMAESIEHLNATEQRITQLISGLLAKAALAAAGEGASKSPISIKMITDRASEKFAAPAALQPTGTPPLSESLAKLGETRAALLRLRPQIEASDDPELTYPHPVFGPLNLYQWLAVVEFHECRHLAQMQRFAEPARRAAD